MGLEQARSNGSSTPRYQRVTSQPENPFASLIPDQQIAIVPSFTLESGVTLRNVPVAYSTRGKLSAQRDNVMVICHALTGSADVSDWWGPLMGGPGRAFDITRFYVVCLNSLGSPYGTASPVTYKDGDPSKGRYGPEFPLTTIRDDVLLHKLVLDDLGVRQIAAVVGGSMGGMLVLEYAFFGKEYVRSIVPIATSSRHSAWGISWGEAQRQCIYTDPKYEDGYYSFDDPPNSGLGAARMSALLTYRSRNSFESRFGRNTPDPSRRQNINGTERPLTPTNEHWAIHNDGNKGARSPRLSSDLTNKASGPSSPSTTSSTFTDPQFHGATTLPSPPPPEAANNNNNLKKTATYFSAQSYLRYQGEKFVKRFDSNCYIAITRKLDTHDVSRNRAPPPSSESEERTDPVKAALALISQPTLVLGIESDGLFTFAEQQELADGIPDSRLRRIESPEGHDAFLLQFEQVNRHILEFFREVLADIMEREGVSSGEADGEGTGLNGTLDGAGGGGGDGDGVGTMTKSSTFGEAEVGDITAW